MPCMHFLEKLCIYISQVDQYLTPGFFRDPSDVLKSYIPSGTKVTYTWFLIVTQREVLHTVWYKSYIYPQWPEC
jgi:hypothetical protein